MAILRLSMAATGIVMATGKVVGVMVVAGGMVVEAGMAAVEIVAEEMAAMEILDIGRDIDTRLLGSLLLCRR